MADSVWARSTNHTEDSFALLSSIAPECRHDAMQPARQGGQLRWDHPDPRLICNGPCWHHQQEDQKPRDWRPRRSRCTQGDRSNEATQARPASKSEPPLLHAKFAGVEVHLAVEGLMQSPMLQQHQIESSTWNWLGRPCKVHGSGHSACVGHRSTFTERGVWHRTLQALGVGTCWMPEKRSVWHWRSRPPRVCHCWLI